MIERSLVYNKIYNNALVAVRRAAPADDEVDDVVIFTCSQ